MRPFLPFLCVVLTVASLAACEGAGPSDPTDEPPPGLALAFPMVGELNQDIFYTNYVDLEPGPDVMDYQCGPKSYDGHRGLDLVLPSFARMDEGVEVVAVAPGQVQSVADGHFDRNKSWNAGGGFGNHVVVSHGGGYVTIYAHMMEGSPRVSAGESVSVGEVLGLVGSSGMSDMPHLHFEVRRNGQALEPFAGPCGPAATHWADPHPYQNEFRLIAADLTAESPLTLDRVKDPPSVADQVYLGHPITLWVHLHHVPVGTAAEWRLYGPGGTQVNSFSRDHGTFYSMSWWWAWFTPLSPEGEWRIDYLHDGDVLATRSFQAVQAGGEAAIPVAGLELSEGPSQATSGGDGGWLGAQPMKHRRR